jgi:hypothetical protein
MTHHPEGPVRRTDWLDCSDQGPVANLLRDLAGERKLRLGVPEGQGPGHRRVLELSSRSRSGWRTSSTTRFRS